MLLLAGSAFAQAGLELTAGYTPGISFIINDDDFAAGEELNYQVTYGSHVGVTAGFNFSERVGVTTGIGLASINQNYVSDYGDRQRDEQDMFNRRLTYIRIPLMVRIGGDPTAPSSAFFRFGPHLDFLAGAMGNSDRRTIIGTRETDTDNFRNYRTILSTEDEEIYRNTVIGLTMEVGGRIRITDVLGVLILFHAETSLTNPEGEDAWKAFNFANGNFTSDERIGSFNVMPGINVSFQYVLNFQ